MWVYLENEASALNLEHVSRLYVEVTGTGAALKAEYNGKTFMVAYYDDKDVARVGLATIMNERDKGTTVYRISRNG